MRRGRCFLRALLALGLAVALTVGFSVGAQAPTPCKVRARAQHGLTQSCPDTMTCLRAPLNGEDTRRENDRPKRLLRALPVYDAQTPLCGGCGVRMSDYVACCARPIDTFVSHPNHAPPTDR